MLNFFNRNSLAAIKLRQTLPYGSDKLDLARDIVQRRFLRNPLKQVLNNLLVGHKRSVHSDNIIFKHFLYRLTPLSRSREDVRILEPNAFLLLSHSASTVADSLRTCRTRPNNAHNDPSHSSDA
jgi:hypothetical protein